MVNFEVGHFGVDARMEGVVEGEESAGEWLVWRCRPRGICMGGGFVPSPSEEGGKVRFIGGHHVLQVAPGLVEEMPEDGAGDDVGGYISPLEDGGLDDCQAAVTFEILDCLAVVCCDKTTRNRYTPLQ